MRNDIVLKAEKECAETFGRIEETALFNQGKVLNAFKKYAVAPRHFEGTSGYGYGDAGRETLANVFKDAFGAEAALVSPHIASGTHSIALALGGALRPSETLLSVTGKPYDTLNSVICGRGDGSLRDFNIGYREIELRGGKIDRAAVKRALGDKKLNVKAVYIQRSRGYARRESLSVAEIDGAAAFIKGEKSDVCVIVDNCYGEFTDITEPAADILAGSLIKNPGGGVAPTGGYVVGRAEYVKKAEYRLTAPGIGAEVGSYADGYKSFFQGLFLAPHVVGQAMKGAALTGAVMRALGFKTSPSSPDKVSDIIVSIDFGDEKRLVDFCRFVQRNSPVDSAAVCEPWAMPGYADKVIMAAGAFNQGASIELSCDAPLRPPFCAYVQGGLTYEHVKTVLLNYVNEVSL